ncbi:glycosyltransferase family 4 protein [Massilia haematophila]|uniref:Glycosyltransferase family 4 protein n=1 Tax=Massilia haematophila TaxID=457923 RepID=A0ABV7PIR6_9BURK|nr:glycosyl transferase [Massilia sp.]
MNDNISVMVLGLRGFPQVQGGVETHAEHLYTELARMGCEVEVVVRGSYQPASNPDVWKGIRFTRLWAPRQRALEAIAHTFAGVLLAAWRRPDVLHIHAIGPALFTPLARLLGLRVVVTHHGPDYDRQKWGRAARFVLRLGERFGMGWSSERIVISKLIRSLVRDKYQRGSTFIPNGVELPDSPPGTQAMQTFDLQPGRYVLLVSRLVPEKRHLDLIEAFALAEVNGWKLVLVGAADHPDEYMRRVLRAARQTPNVVCTGFQSGPGLRELYAHAGLFVLPSSHEGLPIALLEALSHGLPAIASDIPANRELGHLGVEFYPVGDVRSLAGRMRARMLRERSVAEAAAVQQRVAESYCWKHIASETRAVYARILGRAAAPRRPLIHNEGVDLSEQ